MLIKLSYWRRSKFPKHCKADRGRMNHLSFVRMFDRFCNKPRWIRFHDNLRGHKTLMKSSWLLRDCWSLYRQQWPIYFWLQRYILNICEQMYVYWLIFLLQKRQANDRIGNPIVEIKRSYDRLISTMGFPIPIRRHLYIESGPWILYGSFI